MEKLRVIDADAHFVETSIVWEKYLDEKFRSDAPQFAKDNQGRDRLLVGNNLLPYIPAPPGGLLERRPGFVDLELRLKDMDREGIDVMVMYPTKGLLFFGIPDAVKMDALCRAYNNWAAESISINPQRYIAPAVLPQLDPTMALNEAKRALKLGLRGVLIRPNPVGGRNLDHPSFEPLWHFLADNNVPLILHEGTTQDLPQFGLDRYDNFLYRHVVSHAFEQMAATMCLIMGGVLERHPNLRVMIVECGVGWVPYWLDRLDDHQDHWSHASLKLKEKPSDYFRRQCFVAAECAEHLIPFVVNAIGDDNVCFSTDYPHQDHPFEGVVDLIKNMPGINDENKRKILGANAARLFGI